MEESRQPIDGRQANEIRPLTIIPGFISYPEGSFLIIIGQTRVLCNIDCTEKAQMRERHFPTGGCFFQWTQYYN
jgi:ribonuclease PH